MIQKESFQGQGVKIPNRRNRSVDREISFSYFYTPGLALKRDCRASMYPLYVSTTYQKCFSPKFPVWRGTEKLFHSTHEKRLVFNREGYHTWSRKLGLAVSYLGETFYPFSATQVPIDRFPSSILPRNLPRAHARQTEAPNRSFSPYSPLVIHL